MSEPTRIHLPRFLLAVLVCSTALTAVMGASCTTEEEACAECAESGLELYYCVIDSSVYSSCKGSQSLADFWCGGISPSGTVVPADCESSLETGETTWGNSAWDPTSHITYVTATGVYEIDEDFVNDLEADGFAPLSLDSARLRESETGYLYVTDVEPDDLAYALGLQNGDIIKSLNGHDLGTFEKRIDAYNTLKTEAEFELTISRGRNTLTLGYEIVS